MDAFNEIVFVRLPLLLVIGAVAASLAWWQHEGALCRRVGGSFSAGLKVLCVVALAGAWALLTLVSWWCLILAADIALLSTYVLFGAVAAWAVLICAGGLFVSAPVVWGVIFVGLVRREFRYASADAPTRAPAPARALPGI